MVGLAVGADVDECAAMGVASPDNPSLDGPALVVREADTIPDDGAFVSDDALPTLLRA